MSRFAFVLSALFVSASTFAGDQILCTEREPEWSPFLEGAEFAQDVGEVILFDTEAKTVTFGSKDAINTLEARETDDGLLVYGFYSSEEKPTDKINASLRSFVRNEATNTSYELAYSFILTGEGRGTKGSAHVTLSGESIRSMGEGIAEYGYPGISSGTFKFCTSIVKL